ncbi:MAG: phosphotriesterase [Gemmatimonadota bacterium]|nr:phosphotriesterase [Gemmatimonadota bacterium]MDH3369601.1 phosphotriesterase [Gemmatimonadota bacterium]MDH3479260.1 phosphotriesterase [Gemmatimonadota bacterium]MDH3570549.1 phosphotriesterase [Gemmatimonadota bacterium]MDH5549746.1 phosphotriesterase [Gemmatimonadota bacterium]
MKPAHALFTSIALLAIVATLPGCTADGPAPGSVMTVNGPIAPDRMGTTLPHEHVLVDFAGAEVVSPDRYDRDAVFQTVLPYLHQARTLGAQSLVEATPAYLGRDPLLLKQLADASGMHVLVSTGYYGARDDQHLPRHAFTDSADSLAARWIREWTTGIDGTGIRPGFIKIGVDPGPLSDIDRTLIQAAARTHLRTGLTIAAHTGPAAGALEQLAVLEAEGVDPSAWIWVHAQAEDDSTIHVRAARSGAWISFDGLAPDNVERYVARVGFMKAEGLLHRVLVSHDAGWYHVGEPGGGTFRPLDTLFTKFLPALTAAGFTDQEIHQLTAANPADAFAVRVRARVR